MTVLITYGTERGGTAGLAAQLTAALREQGFDVVLREPASVERLDGYEAVVVGGALYVGHWHRDARRFVNRHAGELKQVPTWFFSSGPLDASASEHEIPPVAGVASLMQRVGARGHVTFGGRMDRDAKGLLVSRLAKRHAGDWRDTKQVHELAERIAAELAARRGAA